MSRHQRRCDVDASRHAVAGALHAPHVDHAIVQATFTRILVS